MAVAVKALAEDELIIVLRKRQGLGHLLVGQRPVAVVVVEVVGAVLEEDADRLLRASCGSRPRSCGPLRAGSCRWRCW